jgi:hypothetical protein
VDKDGLVEVDAMMNLKEDEVEGLREASWAIEKRPGATIHLFSLAVEDKWFEGSDNW